MSHRYRRRSSRRAAALPAGPDLSGVSTADLEASLESPLAADFQADLDRKRLLFEAFRQMSLEALRAVRAGDATEAVRYLQMLQMGADHAGRMLERLGASPPPPDVLAQTPVPPSWASPAAVRLREALEAASVAAAEVNAERGLPAEGGYQHFLDVLTWGISDEIRRGETAAGSQEEGG